ncbi:DUF1269 domain-containing protein [Patulibacter sp.]|uniref:DUF1269 domain-containing protein n=1 Tax=Patulibacter sp. TaxID=1912859 RepID=UPI00271AE77B|nr:DUF1269 domain-containing protein [Patulibacter sp.]MDO9410876.1 DUF1269 domain-containing protein [Patulibacter sp.]
MSTTDETTRTLPPEQQNATVAVYADLQHAEDGVRALEAAGFDMTQLSIVARGEQTERHVIGFDDRRHREQTWAGWGALWGVLFGAFFFVPGIGNVAFGGWLLFSIVGGALGAGMGAITAALASVGVPDDASLRYVTAIKADKQLVVAHGTADDIAFAHRVLDGGDAETVESHLGRTAVPDRKA